MSEELDWERIAEEPDRERRLETILMDAYDTDVRPMLADLRAGMGLDPDPLGAYARSGYAERIAAGRVGGQQAGWGA